MTSPKQDRYSKPCSLYDYDALAEIYNQARTDYIIPMPMNGKRLKQYVDSYDVDLDASPVVINENGLESGVGMLGLRDIRGWVTRLGVIPDRRGRYLGQFIMEELIKNASERGKTVMQLEVIVGNQPAHTLFKKLGFRETRELMIVRRPPGMPQDNQHYDAATLTPMLKEEIPTYLDQRELGASWVEETVSLIKIGSLNGFRLQLPSGEVGWIIFHMTPFQISHIVFSNPVSDAMGSALLHHLHKNYPKRDTNVENLPVGHQNWAIYKSMGYMVVFNRTEMLMDIIR